MVIPVCVFEFAEIGIKIMKRMFLHESVRFQLKIVRNTPADRFTEQRDILRRGLEAVSEVINTMRREEPELLWSMCEKRFYVASSDEGISTGVVTECCAGRKLVFKCPAQRSSAGFHHVDEDQGGIDRVAGSGFHPEEDTLNWQKNHDEGQDNRQSGAFHINFQRLSFELGFYRLFWDVFDAYIQISHTARSKSHSGFF